MSKPHPPWFHLLLWASCIVSAAVITYASCPPWHDSRYDPDCINVTRCYIYDGQKMLTEYRGCMEPLSDSAANDAACEAWAKAAACTSSVPMHRIGVNGDLEPRYCARNQ